MAQKPIAMEQLKQVLQLKNDGVSIREIARRAGISRNSVRKYLLRINAGKSTSDQELADSAYSNDLLELEAQRQRQVTAHFSTAGVELLNTQEIRTLKGITSHTIFPCRSPVIPSFSLSNSCSRPNKRRKQKNLTNMPLIVTYCLG